MNLYRTATIRDGFEVAKNLRIEDKMELEGLGKTVLHIPFGIAISEYPTTFYTSDNSLAGVAGIVPQGDGVGGIWMLCTPAIHREPITFFRQSKRWLDSVEGDYKLLWNLADARNHTHHRLLKFLGFRAMRSIPMGDEQTPYLEIVKLCA